MRLSIFYRLIISYMAVFVPVIIVSVYALFQLNHFNNITHSITDTDNLIIDYGKKMSDSFLSQIQYERKYIIIKNNAFYDHFALAEKDFNQYFQQVISIVDTQRKRDLLFKIKNSYNQYLALFNEEIEFIRANKRYPQEIYKQEKDMLVNEIMEGLKNLRIYTEQDTYEKIKKLEQAGARAHRIAIIIITSSLVFGIVISTFITRSITRPLSIMKKKTRDISRGAFDENLNISSPPEIKDLAESFNLMCNKLKEMDKMKSDFFSLMAHELRTPLASIKEGTNLLLEGIGGEVSEKQKKLLSIISEESNRLIELINSLLDLSKMESGMMTFYFTESDITQLINEVIEELEPLAMAKNITLRVDISQNLPAVKIDQERILRVMRNLIGNAIKFTPDGGHITVSARAVDHGLMVSVRDTGPGIPEKDLEIIFDKFKQTTIGSYGKIEGTGLGLAIVKHIINAHGGKVWAESKLGYGSTFIFVLPA